MTIDEKNNILNILQCLLNLKQHEEKYIHQLILLLESPSEMRYDKKLLEQKTISLDMSVRTFNAISRAGILTINDLVRLTHREIRKVRGLGEKGYSEVLQKMEELSLKLADD